MIKCNSGSVAKAMQIWNIVFAKHCCVFLSLEILNWSHVKAPNSFLLIFSFGLNCNYLIEKAQNVFCASFCLSAIFADCSFFTLMDAAGCWAVTLKVRFLALCPPNPPSWQPTCEQKGKFYFFNLSVLCVLPSGFLFVRLPSRWERLWVWLSSFGSGCV